MSARVCCPLSFTVSRALLLLLPAALFFGFPQNARAQAKTARPDSTVADGGWTPAAPNTHLEIDEVAPDDAVTLVQVVGAVGTLEVGLSDIVNANPAYAHILSFRIEADVGNGAAPEKIEMQLYQGVTLIATTGAQTAARGAWTTFQSTLTALEVAAITDYTDLRFRFVPTAAGGETVRVTWAELAVVEPVTSGTNYRSIGTNTGILYNTDTASILIGRYIVDFEGFASLPLPSVVGAVGQGDRLFLDPGGANEEVLYILSRDSNTRVTVQSSAVSAHASETYEIQRAYNTFADWEKDASNGGRGATWSVITVSKWGWPTKTAPSSLHSPAPSPPSSSTGPPPMMVTICT